ncbi:hypothetical protein IWQ61_005011 [Dispira simplex]|nr:hypothetical protein IWQ61_005011 [Dispira simplex]
MLVNRLLSEVKQFIMKLGPHFNLRSSPISTEDTSAGTAPEKVSTTHPDSALGTLSQTTSPGPCSNRQSDDSSLQYSGSSCETSTTSIEPGGIFTLATVYTHLEHISQGIPRRQVPLPKVSTQDMLRGQSVLTMLVNQNLDEAKLLAPLPYTGQYEQSLRKSHREQARAFLAQFQPDPSFPKHQILEAINEYLD